MNASDSRTNRTKLWVIPLTPIQIHSEGRVIVSFSFTRTVARKVALARSFIENVRQGNSLSLAQTRSRLQGMTVQQLLADIHALETELLAFERKYGIRSEIFYAAHAGGDEPENEAWALDFGEWASVYRTWLTRQAEYRNEIEPVQPDKGSLAGLIHVSA